MLHSSVRDPGAVAREHAAQFGAQVSYVYEHALKGYAAQMVPGRTAALSGDSRVAYVERDGQMNISTTQAGGAWGLDRIDQRSLPLSSTYS